jgi:hypothetical protein
VFWPLPLLWWSALPMAPVLQELIVNYFHKEPVRSDKAATMWLKNQLQCNTLSILPPKFKYNADEVPIEIGWCSLDL